MSTPREDRRSMLIHWEYVARTETSNKRVVTYRSAVPGGWLLAVCVDGLVGGMDVLFYPDPSHEWGESSEELDQSSEIVDPGIPVEQCVKEAA